MTFLVKFFFFWMKRCSSSFILYLYSYVLNSNIRSDVAHKCGARSRPPLKRNLRHNKRVKLRHTLGMNVKILATQSRSIQRTVEAQEQHFFLQLLKAAQPSGLASLLSNSKALP